jgi:drug/metabolite transporter (DMT)-like permease
MENFVFIAVLLAAACHAGWNALIKVEIDPLPSTTLIAAGAAMVGIICLPWTGLPAIAAGPWLLASAVIHLFYFIALIESYRAGDLSQVYPIARGSAPLMIAGASTVFVGEHLNPMSWGGILALAGGVLMLSIRGGQDLARIDRRAVGFAFATALAICAYSVVDGIGARASANPPAYTACLFICNTLLVPYALWRDSRLLVAAIKHFWLRGLIGGAMQAVSYGTALWAMTLAPIAVVATLRETSVLFGAFIAVILLKERLRALRIAASLLIVIGLIIMRLA